MSQILKRIRTNASEVIYICGQPGTGKTLTVHRAIQKIIAMKNEKKLDPFTFVAINALNDLTTPQALYSHLHARLTGLKPLAPRKRFVCLLPWLHVYH